VNNSNGQDRPGGLLGLCGVRRVRGQGQEAPKGDIVDILKNYMANKSFSRGIEQVTAEASLAFVGNTSHDVGYMVKTDLFEDLPTVYHDPAFIDRVHAYIPGWEMDIIRGEMFCDRLRLHRGLPRRGAALPCGRWTTRATGFSKRFELTRPLHTRPRRHPQDLLRAS
jgi:ATP-dependent Lon protease